MGNYAVLLVIAFAVVSAALVTYMYSATTDTDEALNHYYHEELARDAAMTGLSMTVRKLAADIMENSWLDMARYDIDATPHTNGATLEVTVEPCVGGPCAGAGDAVDVTAVGTSGTRYNAETDAYDPITVTIQARYKRGYDEGIPPAFRNGITTNDYLQLQGNTGLFSINEAFNASVHTNATINLAGHSMYVEGYVSYTEPDPPAVPSLDPSHFLPNIDYNEGDPNLFWHDDVTIPQLDFDALRNAADTGGSWIQLGGGTLTIDGSVSPILDFTNPGSLPWWETQPIKCLASCGTEDNPYIVVIEGGLNVTFTGDIRIKGYAVIASRIPISVGTGGGSLYGDLNGDGETQVLLAAQDNNIVVGTLGSAVCLGTGPSSMFENALIDGEIVLNAGPSRNNTNCVSGSSAFEYGISLYAGGRITFRGNPYMVGGITAEEITFDGDVNGRPTLSYAAPGKTIINPGFEYKVPIGPVLVAYSEWGTNQVATP